MGIENTCSQLRHFQNLQEYPKFHLCPDLIFPSSDAPAQRFLNWADKNLHALNLVHLAINILFPAQDKKSQLFWSYMFRCFICLPLPAGIHNMWDSWWKLHLLQQLMALSNLEVSLSISIVTNYCPLSTPLSRLMPNCHSKMSQNNRELATYWCCYTLLR